MIRPRSGLKRFDKGEKLAPRLIGPFEVLELVGELSYRLAFPPELSCIHDVFHISALNQIFHMFWIGKISAFEKIYLTSRSQLELWIEKNRFFVVGTEHSIS